MALSPFAASRPEATSLVTRGARRYLAARDFASLTEFSPARGLRADLFAIAPDGEIWIIEVKSSLADYRADAKWRDYQPWCDRLFFAVAPDFPRNELPDDVGLMIADGFGAEPVRDGPLEKLPAARRKALTKSFARQAARRLLLFEDPEFDRFRETS